MKLKLVIKTTDADRDVERVVVSFDSMVEARQFIGSLSTVRNELGDLSRHNVDEVIAVLQQIEAENSD